MKKLIAILAVILMFTVVLTACGKKDKNKAVDYFKKATDYGSAAGQYNLGCLYEKGYGVEQNYVKAEEYYRKAEEKGYPGAHEAAERVSEYIHP